jgi:hypothetical protein
MIWLGTVAWSKIERNNGLFFGKLEKIHVYMSLVSGWGIASPEVTGLLYVLCSCSGFAIHGKAQDATKIDTST